MIDKKQTELLWKTFLLDAKLYETRSEIYLSSKEGGKYKIISTVNNVIKIERQNKLGSYETISYVKFKTIIERINQFNGFIPKGKLYEHVAEETTIVELLTFLDWSNDGKKILILNKNIDLNKTSNSVPEALNDELDTKQIIARKRRRGQNKFRNKLLSVYDGKCAISESAVIQVLQACHLNPHRNSGINISTNGILLRSDIHDLFDENLIAICPDNLIIHVSKILENTEYFTYHGKILGKRNDNLFPDVNSIKERWKEFKIQTRQ
jgi:hypothetical protein